MYSLPLYLPLLPMRALLWLLLPTLLLARPALGQLPALPHPTVLVRGAAEQELDPKKLDLLLTYHFSDNVKAGERTQNQEESLRQVLSQAGIKATNLVLEELSASGYGGLSKVNNTNVALTKVYRLTLDNPQLATTLIPQLAQTGADNLRVVNLQSSQLAAAQAATAAQAVAAARQKAAVVAQAAGGKLGSVIVLTEVLPTAQAAPEVRGAYKVSSAYYEGGYQAPAASAEAPPNLRKIKVLARYDVIFELKP